MDSNLVGDTHGGQMNVYIICTAYHVPGPSSLGALHGSVTGCLPSPSLRVQSAPERKVLVDLYEKVEGLGIFEDRWILIHAC